LTFAGLCDLSAEALGFFQSSANADFDLRGLCDPSAEALGFFQSSANADSPTPVLAIFLHFFGAALTNLPLGLEGNDPAPIPRNFVFVRTMIRATISAGGQTSGRK